MIDAMVKGYEPPPPPLPPEDPKEKLVHTISFGIERQMEHGKKKGTFYYYLFEDKNGKRRMHAGSTLDPGATNLDMQSKLFDDYHEVIFPWLHGRYVKGVPSYNDVDSLDVQAKLSE